MVKLVGKYSQRRQAQPKSKSGVPKLQVPTTASPSIGTSPESAWEIYIRRAREDDDANIWSEHCIYRVPQYLREKNHEVYLPRIVSLGPYHHDNERLRNMDPHKWRAVSHILERCNQNINLYIDAVKDLEDRARACYEVPISLTSDEFVKMMVLDGCFILELFRGDDEGFDQLGYSKSDPIFSWRGSMHMIQLDMIMLENQIPLFVLDRLFELQDGQPKGVVSKLALKFFYPLCPTDEPPSMEMGYTTTVDPQPGVEGVHSLPVFQRRGTLLQMSDPQPDLGGLHCLDVFRRSLLRTDPQPTPDDTGMSDPQPDVGGLHFLDVFLRSLLRTDPQPTPDDTHMSDPEPDVGGLHCLDVFRRFWRRSKPQPTPKKERRQQLIIPCVTKLRESGINFKTRKVGRFWDIKFKDGVLRIPRLLIHYGTKSLFLNLIAFEQCHLESTTDISSYMSFMDNLINSAEDVSILQRCGIIEHWLGSETEVAKLFNGICQEAAFDVSESYLSLFYQVNQYCESRWNTWRATLYHIYFINPWAVISIIAAVVLLSLTFTQTFYGVFAYYRPPS